MKDKQQPYPIAETRFDEHNARFSPDGRWLAYSSDESGKPEVYIQPFAGPHNKFQLSSGGGEAPKWSHDGKKVYYLTLNWKVMEVSVKSGMKVEVGTPRALFAIPRDSEFEVWIGGKFLILQRTERNADSATAVLNWDTALGQKN